MKCVVFGTFGVVKCVAPKLSVCGDDVLIICCIWPILTGVEKNVLMMFLLCSVLDYT